MLVWLFLDCHFFLDCHWFCWLTKFSLLLFPLPLTSSSVSVFFGCHCLLCRNLSWPPPPLFSSSSCWCYCGNLGCCSQFEQLLFSSEKWKSFHNCFALWCRISNAVGEGGGRGGGRQVEVLCTNQIMHIAGFGMLVKQFGAFFFIHQLELRGGRGEGTLLVGFLLMWLSTVQVVIFWLQVMLQVEEGYGQKADWLVFISILCSEKKTCLEFTKCYLLSWFWLLCSGGVLNFQVILMCVHVWFPHKNAKLCCNFVEKGKKNGLCVHMLTLYGKVFCRWQILQYCFQFVLYCCFCRCCSKSHVEQTP